MSAKFNCEPRTKTTTEEKEPLNKKPNQFEFFIIKMLFNLLHSQEQVHSLKLCTLFALVSPRSPQ